MFLTERTYDIGEICMNNFHTHSVFSKCAKPEMVFEDMIKAAEHYGLRTLAITDHSDWDDEIDTYQNTLLLKHRLEQIRTPVHVLIGSELSYYGIGQFSEPEGIDKVLDFRSYSCVHYHLDYWEQPAIRTTRAYARHMLLMMDTLFASGRADAIAHPFSPCKMKFFDQSQKEETLAAITDNELADILLKGENACCSWELHKGTCLCFPAFTRRFFGLGKEVGVHFICGTDAHTLSGLDTKDFAAQLKSILK